MEISGGSDDAHLNLLASHLRCHMVQTALRGWHELIVLGFITDAFKLDFLLNRGCGLTKRSVGYRD